MTATPPDGTFLSAERVVLPDRIASPGWIVIDGGVISATGEGPVPDREAEVLPGYLVPGFVDQHCHGGGGGAFDTDDPAGVKSAVRVHRSHGTTSLIASLVSAAPERLRSQVERLVQHCDAGLIAGIHLEGPWLSPDHKGAHDPQALRHPTTAELEELLAVGGGHIRMVTFAPELPGGMDTIRACVANGVVAAVGHTDATYEQVEDAIAAGATVATHLFNAMRPLGHRDPGPIAALTEDPRVTVELIVDGVHVREPAVALATRAASKRVVLVTDAMAAAGAADGDYVLGTLGVQVRDGIARLTEGGAIAGSTLTMDRALANYVHGCGAPIHSAVAAASATPARLMGLHDRGELRRGQRADVCLLDSDLRLKRVWIGGERRRDD